MFANGSWRSFSDSALVELIGEEFRRYFGLGIPVGPDLPRLLAEADIARAPGLPGTGIGVGYDCRLPNGPWEITLPPDRMQETLHVLRQVWAILFWRCHYRVPWWAQWRAFVGADDPALLAHYFAYAVLLPPDVLRAKALQRGFNVWQLANDFLVTPGACLYALRRQVRYPFPCFMARLQFSVALDQQQLFFEAGSVRAKVWARFLMRAQPGPDALADDTLEALLDFPSRDSVLEVGGWMLGALKSRLPVLETTDRLFDQRLPAPICLIARPNNNGTQLLLQAVPRACQAFLIDDSLRAARAPLVRAA